MSRTNGTVNERQTPADTAVRQEQKRAASPDGRQASAAQLKVALVHDWLVGGGAEKVVLELHHMFPDAPIYTSFCNGEWRDKLDGKVVTGWLQYWPFSKLRKLIPVLRIWWFTHLDLSGYDLVISSSGNGEAKGVKVPEGTKHICYCHSPTHFYWRHYKKYIDNPGMGLLNPLARLGLWLFVAPLRRWDRKAAQRPDYMIANSEHIQRDIKKYYGRDSVVIHPPVEIDKFSNVKGKKREGFVTVGRQVPYKHTDLIVQTCRELDLPLTVVGRGPEHNKLVRLAGPTIKFDSSATDKQVADYMAGAEAFIFAAFEDFGVTPVEAMAAGTPVIAYKAGGALDYVEQGKTGLFFDKQTTASLQQALQKFKPDDYDHTVIKKAARVFSAENFREKLSKAIAGVLNQS